jgi:hypothetical protein
MSQSPLEQLEAVGRLSANWDGYEAAAPRPEVLPLAREFLLLLLALPRGQALGHAIHVSPTRTGGVLLEWQDASHEHEIEFSPDGAISFLHTHLTTGQIENRKFVPAPRGVVPPGLLQELRALAA